MGRIFARDHHAWGQGEPVVVVGCVSNGVGTRDGGEAVGLPANRNRRACLANGFTWRNRVKDASEKDGCLVCCS